MNESSVSQDYTCKYIKFSKFSSNFLECIRIDLKTFLGSTIANQCSEKTVKKKKFSLLLGDKLLSENPLTF